VSCCCGVPKAEACSPLPSYITSLPPQLRRLPISTLSNFPRLHAAQFQKTLRCSPRIIRSLHRCPTLRSVIIGWAILVSLVMAAYEHYRSQPNQKPQYPTSLYEQTYDSRPYQTSSYHQNSHYQDPQDPRSRAPSSAPSDGLQQPLQQPLHNALNNAFDRSDTARAVDPDLIAQITAEVKRSVLDEIKMNGVAGATVQPQPSAPPQHYSPQSPTSTSASFPSRNVYTPPSPKSQGSVSPDPLARESFGGAGDTPTHRFERTAPEDVPLEGSRKPRPAPAPRMSTDADFTPIEKMWQRLFDPQALPTPRLGQFLRGLAIHLVSYSLRSPFLTLTAFRLRITSRRRAWSFRPLRC
jgi:hypothetical protein